MNGVTPSIDVKRCESLAARALERRTELASAIEELPPRDLREREDLGVALTAIDKLLEQDLAHASASVCAELERWLDSSKRYLNDLTRRR